MTDVGPQLETERTVLRQWQAGDAESFAAINADPEVMAHYPRVLSRAETDGMVDRFREQFRDHGYGMWAVERRSDAQLIGFVGLQQPPFEAHFTPCVEIGWRLARDAWGFGYATEGAAAAMSFGFDDLGLDQIVAMCVPDNERSRAVMRRLGMHRDPADDFTTPARPEGAPGIDSVLYRISGGEWAALAHDR